ncbi:pseudouridine synthase [Nannocystaceae bacterium ST9]
MAKSAPKRSSAKPASERSAKPGRSRSAKPTDASSDRRRAPARGERTNDDDKPRTSAKPAAKRKSTRSKPTHDHTPTPREELDGVRLQKYLASAGVASRRHAEDLITAGHVQVNGRVVRELGTRVFGDRDRVTVRGELIKPEPKVYYVLNKPDAMVCSAAGSVDERGRPTVLSLMHGIRERLYPVGRLDYHSRGVVLLTNDGELAEALTHPRHGVVKTYHVKFQGKLDADDEQALREGVELDDGAITRPLTELFAFRETGSNVWYQIGLTEGLNRQIRRMGDAIGHPVLKLLRVAIGDITADGLEEGQHRPLKPTEVAQLIAAVRVAPEPSRRTKKAAKPSAPARKPRPRPSEAPSGAKKAGAKKASASKPTARPAASRSASTGKKPSAKTSPRTATRTSARPTRAAKSTRPPTRPTRK